MLKFFRSLKTKALSSKSATSANTSPFTQHVSSFSPPRRWRPLISDEEVKEFERTIGAGEDGSDDAAVSNTGSLKIMDPKTYLDDNPQEQSNLQGPVNLEDKDGVESGLQKDYRQAHGSTAKHTDALTQAKQTEATDSVSHERNAHYGSYEEMYAKYEEMTARLKKVESQLRSLTIQFQGQVASLEEEAQDLRSEARRYEEMMWAKK